jgi:hypothetical protein
VELVKKMMADPVLLRNDEHLKNLAEKESLLKEQAFRLAELEEQLQAQSSAAAATRKSASKLVVPQAYSPSEEELQESFLRVKEFPSYRH